MPVITRHSLSKRKQSRKDAAKRKKLHKKKKKLTPNQRKAIAKMKARGIFKKIAAMREDFAADPANINSQQHTRQYIDAILTCAAQAKKGSPEDELGPTAFVQHFLSRPSDYSNTKTGLAAVMFEAWMCEKEGELFKKFVETILEGEGKPFKAVFQGKIEEGDLERLKDGVSSFCSFEVVVKADDKSETGDVSDLTILECKPVGTPDKSMLNPALPTTKEEYKKVKEDGGIEPKVFHALFRDAEVQYDDAEQIQSHVDENGVTWYGDGQTWIPDYTTFVDEMQVVGEAKKAWHTTREEYVRPFVEKVFGKPEYIYAGTRAAKAEKRGLERRRAAFEEKTAKRHRELVRDALLARQPVPAVVLRDYPDLALSFPRAFVEMATKKESQDETDSVSEEAPTGHAYYRLEVYKPPDDMENEDNCVQCGESSIKLEGAIAVIPSQPGNTVMMFVQGESPQHAEQRVQAFLEGNGAEGFKILAFDTKLYIDQEGTLLSNYLTWEVKERDDTGIQVFVDDNVFTLPTLLNDAQDAIDKIAQEYEGMPAEADMMVEQFLKEYCEANGEVQEDQQQASALLLPEIEEGRGNYRTQRKLEVQRSCNLRLLALGKSVDEAGKKKGKMKYVRAKKGIADYYNTPVDWGGKTITLAQAISKLQKQGTKQVYIDRWVQGLMLGRKIRGEGVDEWQQHVTPSKLMRHARSILRRRGKPMSERALINAMKDYVKGQEAGQFDDDTYPSILRHAVESGLIKRQDDGKYVDVGSAWESSLDEGKAYMFRGAAPAKKALATLQKELALEIRGGTLKAAVKGKVLFMSGKLAFVLDAQGALAKSGLKYHAIQYEGEGVDEAEDVIDRLIKQYQATGRVAHRYPRLKRVALDGHKSIPEKEAIVRMKGVVGKKEFMDEGKQPKGWGWNMTQAEFIPRWTKAAFKGDKQKIANRGPSEIQANTRVAKYSHEARVKSALAAGKPVPAKVLADYPDLARKAKKESMDEAADPFKNPKRPEDVGIVVDRSRRLTSLSFKDGEGNVLYARQQKMVFPDGIARSYTVIKDKKFGKVLWRSHKVKNVLGKLVPLKAESTDEGGKPVAESLDEVKEIRVGNVATIGQHKDASGDIRYELSGTHGMFIDKPHSIYRSYQHNKYEVWLPGAGKGGIAKFIGGAATLKAAVEIAANSVKESVDGTDSVSLTEAAGLRSDALHRIAFLEAKKDMMDLLHADADNPATVVWEQAGRFTAKFQSDTADDDRAVVAFDTLQDALAEYDKDDVLELKDEWDAAIAAELDSPGSIELEELKKAGMQARRGMAPVKGRRRKKRKPGLGRKIGGREMSEDLDEAAVKVPNTTKLLDAALAWGRASRWAFQVNKDGKSAAKKAEAKALAAMNVALAVISKKYPLFGREIASSPKYPLFGHKAAFGPFEFYVGDKEIEQIIKRWVAGYCAAMRKQGKAAESTDGEWEDYDIDPRAVVEVEDIAATARQLTEAGGLEPEQAAPLKKRYTQYVLRGNTFEPVGDITLKETLQPFAYRVHQTMSGPVFEKFNPRSDDLLKFENSVMEGVLNEIDEFWGRKEKYDRLGLLHNRGILLHGSPGTGKTCLLQQVGEMMVERGDVVFYATNVHAMESALKAFREAEPDRKVVIVFEDVDEAVRYDEKALLQLLDGAEMLEGVLYLGTTNYLERFPARLIRPGRFDKLVEVGPPPYAGRLAYLKHKLNGIEKDAKITELAKRTDGLSFGHLREFIIGAYALDEPADEVIKRLRGTPVTELATKEDTPSARLAVRDSQPRQHEGVNEAFDALLDEAKGVSVGGVSVTGKRKSYYGEVRYSLSNGLYVAKAADKYSAFAGNAFEVRKPVVGRGGTKQSEYVGAAKTLKAAVALAAKVGGEHADEGDEQRHPFDDLTDSVSVVESGDDGVNQEAVKMLTAYILNELTARYVAEVGRPVALYKARGDYDGSKAHKLALHLVQDAGRKYHAANDKGSDQPWHAVFNEPTREAVMKKLKAQAESDAAAYKFDAVLPAKWRKDGDGKKDEALDEDGEGVLAQFGGKKSLKKTIGAKNFVLGDRGKTLTFRIKRNKTQCNAVRIGFYAQANKYSVEFGKQTRDGWERLKQGPSVSLDQLRDTFIRLTGLDLGPGDDSDDPLVRYAQGDASDFAALAKRGLAGIMRFRRSTDAKLVAYEIRPTAEVIRVRPTPDGRFYDVAFAGTKPIPAYVLQCVKGRGGKLRKYSGSFESADGGDGKKEEALDEGRTNVKAAQQQCEKLLQAAEKAHMEYEKAEQFDRDNYDKVARASDKLRGGVDYDKSPPEIQKQVDALWKVHNERAGMKAAYAAWLAAARVLKDALGKAVPGLANPFRTPTIELFRKQVKTLHLRARVEKMKRELDTAPQADPLALGKGDYVHTLGDSPYFERGTLERVARATEKSLWFADVFDGSNFSVTRQRLVGSKGIAGLRLVPASLVKRSVKLTREWNAAFKAAGVQESMAEGGDAGFDIEDMQNYYDAQQVMGKAEQECLRLTKLHFKVKRLVVGPTGKLESPDVDDPPEPPEPPPEEEPPPDDEKPEEEPPPEEKPPVGKADGQ